MLCCVPTEIDRFKYFTFSPTKQRKFFFLCAKSPVSVGQTYFICRPDEEQENIEYHEDSNEKINVEWI